MNPFLRAAFATISTLLLTRNAAFPQGPLAGTSAASAVLQATQERQQSLDKEQENKEQERREKRQEEFRRQHTDPSGRVRPDLWQQGIEQFKRMQAAPQAVPSDGIGTRWTQIGPAPLVIDPTEDTNGKGPDSGMVTDIAIDPRGTTDQTIYISTNNGGIWKTTDGGQSWTPKTDFMPSLSMGAVALDPGNPSIVYAGTGNIFQTGFFNGVGVYKSTNGGDTWTVLNPDNIFSGVGINRIVLPAAGTLLVATNGGLFRSAIGAGGSFSRIPTGSISYGYITDLKVDTASPSTVYAAVNGVGIFKSTDYGASFPASGILFTPPLGSFGFIAFAQSTQPNNQTMYANVELLSGPAGVGMFRSTNGGAGWTQITLGSEVIASCQCHYDQTIGVDPQDANRVFFGLRSLYLSTDGGASGIYDKITNPSEPQNNRIDYNIVHADQHAIVFSPPSHYTGPAPTRFYNGTDGGIATSGDGGTSWDLLNNGISTVLFRQIDIGRGSVVNNAYTFGAAQDLGISQHRPSFDGNDWLLGIGGDGNAIAVDPLDSIHAIGEAGGFTVSTTDGRSWPQPSGGFPANTSLVAPGTSNALVAFDPNGGRAYAVAYTSIGPPPPSTLIRLFQSTDNAVTFSPIHRFFVAVTAINQTKLDSNTIWVGLNDGTVQRTSNALAGASSTWFSHNVTGAPANQAVAGIAIDPSNTNQVVVVYAGFSGAPLGNRTQHAFMTTDNGATWNDISGTDGGNPLTNLPDLSLHAVVIDPGTSPHSIIVASDAGVLRTADLGATWQVLGTGLPIVDCTSLALDSTAGSLLLRVGTFGRSAFELTISAIYVDWANTSGIEDGSSAHPYRTVTNGYAAAMAGDTIIIRVGNYPETISFDKNKAVTVRSEGGTVRIGTP